MSGSASSVYDAKKVLLVDDHPTFREGLRSLISHLDAFSVCAEADGEHTALLGLAAESPDLMIVDLNLKEGSGLKLICRARKAYPALNILVASMYEESLYGERAINAGANGYVCKQDHPELLLKAIHRVGHGEAFFSRKLATRLLALRTTAETPDAGDPVEMLTDREIQVFNLVGTGLSTKEIASMLHLSPKTVDTHRDHIKKKLGVTDSVRLVHRAVEWVLSQ